MKATLLPLPLSLHGPQVNRNGVNVGEQTRLGLDRFLQLSPRVQELSKSSKLYHRIDKLSCDTREFVHEIKLHRIKCE
jgi:hypothetical protein